jgi:predicted N-acetyltransferase YhbS
MTHTLRTLAPADEAAVHALWAICFDAPHLPALHALDPDRHRRTFVAARGDTVDAVVCYVPRQLRDAHGRVERVGGIGNVATRPEARGHGLVRRLLTIAAEAMISESCAWSLLFTATPGVYERSGWTGFRTSWTEGPLTTVGPPEPRFRIRAATPTDAPRLAELHAGFNAARPLTAVRTANDWIHRVPAWYGPGAEWLIAEDNGGTAVGYTVTQYIGEAVEVRECAVTEAAPAALGELLAAVARRARTAGAAVGRAHLPEDPAVRAALPRLLAQDQARERTQTVGMARPLLAPPEAIRATLQATGATHWHGDSF